MGFISRMARFGAVGGTARLAARTYHHVTKNNSNADMDTVGGTLIFIRYGRAMAHRPNGQKARTGEALTNLGQNGEIRGLAHLTVLILVAEAGFAENDIRAQHEFMMTIIDELERKDVPLEYILGSTRAEAQPLPVPILLAEYHSSIRTLVRALK